MNLLNVRFSIHLCDYAKNSCASRRLLKLTSLFSLVLHTIVPLEPSNQMHGLLRATTRRPAWRGCLIKSSHKQQIPRLSFPSILDQRR
jgi:hypothetical protein